MMQVTQSRPKITAMDFFDVNLTLYPAVCMYICINLAS